MGASTGQPKLLRQLLALVAEYRERVLAMHYQRASATALRARCETILRNLPIAVPFEERNFCAALAAQRGRPIILRPLSLQELIGHADVYGMVIDKATADIIVYERDTSRPHQQQIILHEACHLILGHRLAWPHQPGFPPLPESIMSGGEIRHVLYRHGYASAAEHEAEILASLILGRAAAAPLIDGYPVDTAMSGDPVRLATLRPPGRET